MLSTEYNSNTYSTSYGNISGEFIVANCKTNYRFYKYLSVEADVNNVFDRNYTLVEGYPEEGRNYLVDLIF